jgi:SAM-dependent methyltransferase
MKILKYISDQINSVGKIYTKSSNWGKVLILFMLFILVIVIFKGINKKKEGFEQSEQFLFKENYDIYDDFYADIYDYLVYNDIKNQYEVGEIVNKTSPSSESIILDIGCGTGHHVDQLSSQNLQVVGIDISPSMISKAKENYPQYDFKLGDVLVNDTFQPSSFTHILCLYFTIYYMKDKQKFFNNCYDWLMSGGYLIVHLVNRDQFDPILPPGNPLALVSPQKYAKNRITTTKIKFTDFSYGSDFQLDKNKNEAKFIEKFKNDKSGKTRKNEHTLYMESQKDILQMAQESGFILEGQIDLVKAQYEYQYLYVLIKPS